MVDYVVEAFGGWPELARPDGPLKYALNAIFGERHIETFARFLNSPNVDGISGDPGWEIERKGPRSNPLEWPEDAEFKAAVDPQFFAYDNPEFFFSKEKLFTYIQTVLNVYCRVHPERESEVRTLFSVT
jgi:hypothetical protein